MMMWLKKIRRWIIKNRWITIVSYGQGSFKSVMDMSSDVADPLIRNGCVILETKREGEKGKIEKLDLALGNLTPLSNESEEHLSFPTYYTNNTYLVESTSFGAMAVLSRDGRLKKLFEGRFLDPVFFEESFYVGDGVNDYVAVFNDKGAEKTQYFTERFQGYCSSRNGGSMIRRNNQIYRFGQLGSPGRYGLGIVMQVFDGSKFVNLCGVKPGYLDFVRGTHTFNIDSDMFTFDLRINRHILMIVYKSDILSKILIKKWIKKYALFVNILED